MPYKLTPCVLVLTKQIQTQHKFLGNHNSQLTLTMSCDANPPWQLLLEGIPSITPGQGLYVSLDQQRPLLVFITLAIISGSSPKRIPRFVASETPIMLTASNRLLQILAAYKIIINNILINQFVMHKFHKNVQIQIMLIT